MTSATWSVNSGALRYVAKLTPQRRGRQFEAGLSAAERLARHGLDAGAPVRSADGSLCVPVDGHLLALLRHVPGRPLDPDDPVDQQWWGDRLGAVHRLLAGFTHAGLPAWHWLRSDAPHLGRQPWLRPAVGSAIAALTRLQVTDRLTVGVLHGDPRCGAFLLDPATGRIGVVDWGSIGAGPLMYDVASAVMYAGGPDRAVELIAAYVAAGPVPRAEVEATLPTLLRFRWAVQADLFAGRLAKTGQTGSPDSAADVDGLSGAREALRDPSGSQVADPG